MKCNKCCGLGGTAHVADTLSLDAHIGDADLNLACIEDPSPNYSVCVYNVIFVFIFLFVFLFCSATLLAFLVELLKSSVAMQEQMLGGKGFLVIGYLLEKVGHFKSFLVFFNFYGIVAVMVKCEWVASYAVSHFASQQI